jgi:hypothetical protein
MNRRCLYCKKEFNSTPFKEGRKEKKILYCSDLCFYYNTKQIACSICGISKSVSEFHTTRFVKPVEKTVYSHKKECCNNEKE